MEARIIKDNPYGTLLEESVFPSQIEIRKKYQIFYRIVNKLTVSQALSLLTDSSDEIKLINAVPLRRYEERKLEVQLDPFSAGPKMFQILLSNPRAGKHVLLEKKFYVEDNQA